MPKPPITNIAETTNELLRQAQSDPELDRKIGEANTLRWAMAEDMRTLRALQPHLPELPDAEVLGVYDRVREAESRLVAPRMRVSDYSEGTAGFDNELVVIGGGRLLLSAEHATTPPRKKGSGADAGTAGLAAVVADWGVESIIPVGRQTSNAVSDPEHPIKYELRRRLFPDRVGFISLHGMNPNKVTGLLDESEIHVLVGLGTPTPRDSSLEVAERSIRLAREDLGLRVAVGNHTDFLLYANDPNWNGVDFRDKTSQLQYIEGLPATNRLEAGTPHTTVNFVLEQTVGRPDLADMPAFQLELSRSIRLTPDDRCARDRTRAAMGVYMGYRVLQIFVDSAYAVASQTDTISR